MIPASTTTARTGPAPWGDRVEATDWDTVRANLDIVGCGLVVVRGCHVAR